MKSFCLLVALAFLLAPACARGTVPTFEHAEVNRSFTLAGGDPSQARTTTIPTVLVPLVLRFESQKTAGEPVRLDASPDVPHVLYSPVFSDFTFPTGGHTQYTDALLRTTFPAEKAWHTLLGQPKVKPLQIDIPIGDGYILTSHKTGRTLAIADLDFVERQIFRQLGHQSGLVLALAHNTTFYADGDATICCSWGTHGVDPATGSSFVLSSYLQDAPTVVSERDVQPLTEQLAEFVYDPLHNPLLYGREAEGQGNRVPAWRRTAPEGGGGGTGIGSAYFLLEPTDINHKNNIPVSPSFPVQANAVTYHLQNVALLPWYIGTSAAPESMYSFPDGHVLTARAEPCRARGSRFAAARTAARPTPRQPGADRSHQLIGYWTGRGPDGSPFPLRAVSPQWDVVLVAFAPPEKNGPAGTMTFQPPAGIPPAQLKANIALLKSRGVKVMISLGGGGAFVALNTPASVRNFVSSVTRIVDLYGFDGVDIDFETPSLDLEPGDTDFRHPVTPSIVHLIAALRTLRAHFGPGFMLSLVPEGTQIPGGFPSYGGQFGSYLPIVYALRDILSFVDVQDYNTPPLEGLDGEIHQSGTVDYHAAMTELLLRGFHVGGNPAQFFPPLPPGKVAIGFLVGYTTPSIVSGAMQYLITGEAPAGTGYRLRQPTGYPGLLGAMFWTIDADRRDGYSFSNRIGPQLHRYRTAP